jgi:thiamine pyrophosphate-dependent acetolactate synthase large subunit-like protein
MRMTTDEAFVKVLQRHGIDHAFGITGSAFMPISDPFPKASITSFATAVKTACRHHAPLLSVTPQAANRTIGRDPERGGCGDRRHDPGLDGAGRTARCAGPRGLSAQ